MYLLNLKHDSTMHELLESLLTLKNKDTSHRQAPSDTATKPKLSRKHANYQRNEHQQTIISHKEKD